LLAMSSLSDGTDIIAQAFGLVEAVSGFADRARRFYYEVMLWGHSCPACSNPLAMVAEGRCRCQSCGITLDPTITFQRCPACGGEPALRVRRYQCRDCGADVPSRFLFDGLVFDAEYFRQKMAEHRQYKAELRERVRQMLAGSRSQPVLMPSIELTGMPDLLNALAGLTAVDDMAGLSYSAKGFDLQRYETHVQAHIGPIAVDLEKIPPLSENRRLDLVRRFLAVLFLASASVIDIWQDGSTIWVIQHETDREGQDVPGGTEEADGVEGPMGGAATW
jgi:predicted RNA-binding Zn-ribbon protein involved in translation (DUF1610 family)